jgi:Arc/MetJ-type ribon-helix-helix transcriptional regulator
MTPGSHVRCRDAPPGCNLTSNRIPIWYHELMSTQIAVRLPDETVAFLDRLVAEKKAASRAEIIARALERERRREIAARDAAILAETGEDPDLAGLVRYVTGHPVDPDR